MLARVLKMEKKEIDLEAKSKEMEKIKMEGKLEEN